MSCRPAIQEAALPESSSAFASAWFVAATKLCSALSESVVTSRDAIGRALSAERCQPRVDRLADCAELGIGGVAECQHAELHAVEPRRFFAHQLGIGVDRARRRLALAPGRRDHHETADLREIHKLE